MKSEANFFLMQQFQNDWSGEEEQRGLNGVKLNIIPKWTQDPFHEQHINRAKGIETLLELIINNETEQSEQTVGKDFEVTDTPKGLEFNKKILSMRKII